MIGVDEPYDHWGGDPADGRDQAPPATGTGGAESVDPAAGAAADPPETMRAQEPGGAADTADTADGTDGGDTADSAAGRAELEGAGQAGSVGLPPPEPTGDERVDMALARFAELTATPVADHVAVFEDVQRRMQDVLASIDHEEPPDPAGEASPGAATGPHPDPGDRAS
ncbi:MAG TPA: hypothetical protein VF069_10930 [Streptosporangiaceae bacterium]